MAEALLISQQEEKAKQTEGPQEHTMEMFEDIRQKLSELSTIEQFKREVTEMKNTQLQTCEQLNDAKRKEKSALEANEQLMDRISKLESDLDHQKILNKDYKREKQQAEQQSLQLSAKVEQLQEVLKMFQQNQNQV